MAGEMTAQSLFELVDPLPREAWPVGLRWAFDRTWHAGLADHAAWPIEPTHVASLFVASLTTWLTNNVIAIQISNACGYSVVVNRPHCKDNVCSTGPTLLHALVAAANEVK